MNFIYSHYLIPVLAFVVVFMLFLISLEMNFFKMIRTYWFYKRSTFHLLSTFFYFLFFLLLSVSVLDLRGPETKVETKASSDRTIILLDTSASMLAEDVSPSRLQKAILIAKHFARKAVGHQISIVVFAEIQKKIVPFTNDLDLIDSRLESLKNLKNQYASSALSQALQESIQYFKESGEEEQGNIIILTDGEETSDTIDLNISKNIRIALVGIGTENGGRIPLDDASGIRFGYKKDKGIDVITKLNDEFFKTATSKLPTSKLWLANSYSLPSEEILDFFTSEKKKTDGLQNMIVRPVLMEWLVVPAIFCLILSIFIKRIRTFTLPIMLFFILDANANEGEALNSLNKNQLEKLEKLHKGKLNKLEKIKLADDLYKHGAKDEGLTIFHENLGSQEFSKDIPPEAYLNYGTSLLEKGHVNDGISIYSKTLENLNDENQKKKFKQIIEKNLVTYFKQKQQNKNQQNKDEKNSSNDQQQQSSQQGSGESKQDSKSKSSEGNANSKNNFDQKNEKQQKKNSKEDENDQGEKNENEKKDKDQKDEKNQNDTKLNPGIRKKLPAKLKQLMSDDRQLQMKVIENGTRELNKRKSRKSKDW